MNQQEIAGLKLVSALKECAIHQARMSSAGAEAANFPSLVEGAVQPLTESEIRVLDQLVFRFGKLQDAIGVRLLPALLQLVQEWRDNEPFLDKLNRAEKLGWLASVEQWQWLRELRNQTAHEYPDHPELTMENLRRLVAHVPMLVEVFRQLADVAMERLSARPIQDSEDEHV